MPEDIATLGVAVTDNAQTTTQNLNDLTAASVRAEAASISLGKATGVTAADMEVLQQKSIAALQAQYGLTEAEAKAALGIKEVTTVIQQQNVVTQQNAEIVAKAAIQKSTTLAVNAAMTKQMFAQMTADEVLQIKAHQFNNKAVEAEDAATLAVRVKMAKQLTAELAAEGSAAAAAQIAREREMIADGATAAAAQIAIEKATADAVGGITVNRMGMVQLGRVVKDFASGDLLYLAADLEETGARFNLLNGATLGWVAVLGITVGAIVAATVAGEQYYKEQQKMILATTGLGAASQVTASQLQDIAQVSSKANGLTVVGSQQAASAFADMGVIGEDNINSLTDTLKTYAEMTGEKLPAAQSELGKSFGENEDSILALNDKYHFLNETQLEHIQHLSDLGEKEQVQTIAIEAWHDRVSEVNKSTGDLNTTLQNEINWFANLWNSIGKVNQAYATQIGLVATLSGLGLGPLATQGTVFAPKPGNPSIGAGIGQAGAQNYLDAQAFKAEQTLPETQFENSITKLTGLRADLEKELATSPAGSPAAIKAKEAWDVYNDTIQRTQTNLAKYGGTLQGVQNQIAKLQADLKNTPRGAGRTGIEEQIYDLQHETDLKTNVDLSASARGAGGVAGAKAARGAHNDNTERFGADTDKINDSATALLKEADAYGADGFAAMQAKAHFDALTAARQASEGVHGEVISQTMIAAREQANLNKAIDDSLLKTSQATLGLEDKTKVQKQVNDLMIAQNISEAVAQKRVADAIELSHLQEIADKGNAAQQAAATTQIEKRTQAQEDANAAAEKAALIAFAQSITNAPDKREKPNQEQLDYNDGLPDARKDLQSIVSLENQTYQTRLANRQNYVNKVNALVSKDKQGQEQAALAIQQYDAQTNQARLHNTENMFTALSSLSNLKSKELQAIGKAAAIAAATMDMYAAINKALAALPYPADLPGAIAVGIEGAANIASIAGLKDGGMVYGAGGPKDDKVLIRASAGEFVANAEGTSRNRPVLEAINRGATISVPAYAAGGYVGTGSSSSAGGMTIHNDFSHANFSGTDPQEVGNQIDLAMRRVYGPAIVQTSVGTTMKTTNKQNQRQTLNRRTSR